METILITGGAGFSGSHFADCITACTDWHIVVLDCLTYCGKMSNLSQVPADRMTFINHDFRYPLTPKVLETIGNVDFLCHLGAETAVPNSLHDPVLFVQSNVIGTLNILEASRILKPERFLFVSTDEVYGPSSNDYAFKESAALLPSNPYSASKAGAEMLCHSYFKSFGVPVIVSRSSNIYGSRQNSEKYIPMVIEKSLRNEIVEVHTDGSGNCGSRQWIHASDQAKALLFLLQKGQIGEKYNIAGERRTNLEVVEAIAKRIPVKYRLFNAYEEYKGHDLHYFIDDSKIRRMGFSPKVSFEEGLALTLPVTEGAL